MEKIPKNITSENSANERKIMYAQGGIYFISSRIMVMDLLVDRIPSNLVTGILVAKVRSILSLYLMMFYNNCLFRRIK